MKRNTILFILTILILIGLFILIRSGQKRLDLSFSLNKEDKIPFGTFIFNSELKNLFPNTSIGENNSSLYDYLKKVSSKNSLLFFVNSPINPNNVSKLDFALLKSFVSNGNSLFISSRLLNQPLNEDLKIEFNNYYFNHSNSIHLNSIDLKPNRAFVYKLPNKLNLLNGYYSFPKNKNIAVLGFDQWSHPNFIRISLGKGFIFLHACPEIFSNYFILYKNNAHYLSGVLNQLPDNVKYIVWDNYYQIEHIPLSPEEFLLTQANLKIGLICFVLAFIAVALFQFKRRQRIVPNIPAPKNLTLEFIETLGLLYYEKKDHRNLVNKMIIQFKEYIQIRFYLSIKDFDKEAILNLSAKTGKNHREIESLISTINTLQGKSQIEDLDLILLNEQLQQFYI